jgi:hypothetical protein
MRSAVPAILAFDVEPDALEVAHEPRPWRGFEALLGSVDEARARLEDLTGRAVRFGWFLRMDPQIAESHGSAEWVVAHYGEAVDRLSEAGDEIGVHPHAWRWSATRQRWFGDHGDPGWVRHCIELSLRSYRTAFGRSCVSMRFGDRYTSPDALSTAVELGIRYDLTIEPGMPAARSVHPGVATTGRIPGYARAARAPYLADPADPLRPSVNGGGGVWMIPLTSVDTAPLMPAWRRVVRRVRRPLNPRHRTANLYVPWDPIRFWQVVDRHVAASPAPYLAFAVRTDAFLDTRRGPAVFDKLAALRFSAHGDGLEFTTPAGLVASLGLGDRES